MSKTFVSDQHDTQKSREKSHSDCGPEKTPSNRSEERAIITGRLMAFAQEWEQRYADEHDGF